MGILGTDAIARNRESPHAQELRHFYRAALGGSLVAFLMIAVPFATQTSAKQHEPPTQREITAFAERAHREAKPGEPVPIPPEILNDLADANCRTDTSCKWELEDRSRAYQFKATRRSASLLAVQGGGRSLCGATGNCPLQVFRLEQRKFETIFDGDVVQTFGFLHSRTHGYPDFVTWAHGSATELGGMLFRFDGEEYRESLGWGEDYRILDDEGHETILEKPRLSLVYWDGERLPR